MEYILAVYRSRNMAIKAYNYLCGKGVTCAIVSTPRAANVGCGLSVKLARDDFSREGQALARAESFAGFFLYKSTYSGGTLTSL